MKELTRAEEQIMQILWKKSEGFVNDILDEMPDPKPAYNTVSTIVRILEKKGFVAHKAFGKAHQYYPLIQKKSYMRSMFSGLMRNYFSGSYRSLASFFTRENNISLEELEEINQLINNEIERKKQEGDE
jgi:predicted transcriptional regulator